MRPSGSLPWSDASTWSADGLRREVFFFESGGERLYGSLYASPGPARRVGVVVCSSWGIEADRAAGCVYGLARAAATLGGTALVFHYPGHGDSTGRSESITMDQLTGAAADATAEASRRVPGLTWALAGVTFGASVAVLAQRRAGARGLLLVQPFLDPAGYVERHLAHRRGARLEQPGRRGFAFGYPIPDAILGLGAAGAASVRQELTSFDGAAAVAVEYATPRSAEPALDGCERIIVSGRWRFGLASYPALERGGRRGLRRVMEAMS